MALDFFFCPATQMNFVHFFPPVFLIARIALDIACKNSPKTPTPSAFLNSRFHRENMSGPDSTLKLSCAAYHAISRGVQTTNSPCNSAFFEEVLISPGFSFFFPHFLQKKRGPPTYLSSKFGEFALTASAVFTSAFHEKMAPMRTCRRNFENFGLNFHICRYLRLFLLSKQWPPCAPEFETGDARLVPIPTGVSLLFFGSCQAERPRRRREPSKGSRLLFLVALLAFLFVAFLRFVLRFFSSCCVSFLFPFDHIKSATLSGYAASDNVYSAPSIRNPPFTVRTQSLE